MKRIIKTGSDSVLNLLRNSFGIIQKDLIKKELTRVKHEELIDKTN